MASARLLLTLLCSALAVATACAGESVEDPLAGLTIVSEDASDSPIRGLDPEWRARFDRGDALFEAVFRDSQGLGPVYIRQSCASCHADDARGPGSVRKMVLVGADGITPLADQSGLAFGHTVRPQVAAGAELGITAPAGAALLLTSRFGPAVYGRGYLEAIEDSEIERVAAEQERADEDGVSGRINRVPYQAEPNEDDRYHAHRPGEAGLIGRFGLKARIAGVDEFTADAFQGDMGITSPLRPNELPNPAAEDDDLPGEDIDAETVNLTADYVRLLRIPTRGEAARSAHGAALFAQAGCDRCHVPRLHTRADYPIAALADTDAEVYTDLLLHDMGPEFSDGLSEHDASASEWRTAPLLGLRHLRNYLHDGRARDVEEAIVLHGGEGSEAAASVSRFMQLDAQDRAQLIEFVSAL